MDIMDDRAQQHSYINGPSLAQTPARTVPIIQQPTIQTSAPSGDAMDVTPGTATMGPPSRTSPDSEANGTLDHIREDQPSSGSLATPNAAAAAAAGGGIQPKVVQTAFIHKLYSMLEDVNIRHLISWSASQDSFVMSPSSDFSKVLSQYFKHTNISSFVRQLNMYGFHKVSDVFHQNAPETPLWEFKHGQNSFKRGDVVGLREIRRRASRQSLVHRDSYSAPKPPLSQPGTPGEPILPIQESTESRLTYLEHGLFEMHAKNARDAESQHFFHVRHQVLMDTLARVLQLNLEMSRMMVSLASPESGLHRDVIAIQGEIQRHMETINRCMEDPNEPPLSSSRPYFSNLTLDNPPSPRQMPQDEPRRSSFLGVPPRQNFHRPPIPSHLSLAARRGFGSISGAATGQSSPSSLRPQAPQPAPQPHPLANSSTSPPNMSRRHTSADIRNVGGWQPSSSPYASGQSSSQYPSSPKRSAAHMASEDQRIRDSFSMYSLSGATHGHSMSRPATPPSYTNGNATENLNNWSWSGPRDKGLSNIFRDSSGPPTRRGSMAHILNPAETAESAEEHEEDMLREEDRKRKRLQ